MRNLLIAGATLAAIAAAPANAVIVDAVTIGLNDVFATGTPGLLTADYNIFTTEEGAFAVLIAEAGDENGVDFNSVVNSFLTVETGELIRTLTFTLTDGATWTSIGSLSDSVTPAVASLSADRSQLFIRFLEGEPLGVSLGDVGFGGTNFVFNANGATNYGLGLGIAAVPEPAAWALMIVGFGLVGTTLRRRARATVVTA